MIVYHGIEPDEPADITKQIFECSDCSWKGKYHELYTAGLITLTGSVIVLRCPICRCVLGAG